MLKLRKLLAILANIVIFTNVLFAQASEQYACKQIINGNPTGQTIVLTITHLPNNIVHVEKSMRSTQYEDLYCGYNLTVYPAFFNENGQELTIVFGNDTWFIPFEGDLMAVANGGEQKLKCACTNLDGAPGSGCCSPYYIIATGAMGCEHCPNYTCHQLCKQNLEDDTISKPIIGVFVQAGQVTF